jgi:hypothetical protein
MSKEDRAFFAAGEESFRSCGIIPALNKLLDQFNHHKPAPITSFRFHGPSETLYQLLKEQNGGILDGLPESADALVAWLKVNANARRVRQERILVSFPPLPRRAGVEMIRVERAENPDQYQPLVDGVRV